MCYLLLFSFKIIEYIKEMILNLLKNILYFKEFGYFFLIILYDILICEELLNSFLFEVSL